MEYLNQILWYLQIILDLVGIIIIIWGGGRATYALIIREFEKETVQKRHEKLDILRYDFGFAMVVALEYFLAGDLIILVLAPNWEELGQIGALIAIRTALSFFLGKEIKLR